MVLETGRTCIPSISREFDFIRNNFVSKGCIRDKGRSM